MIDLTKIKDLSLNGYKIKNLSLNGKRIWNGTKKWNNPFYVEAIEPNTEVGIQPTANIGSVTFECSTDNVNWTTKTATYTDYRVTLANVGDRIYYRSPTNSSPWTPNATSYVNLYTSANVKCGGNVMSLVDKSMTSDTVQPYQFMALFSLSKITTAPKLPAKTISTGSYYAMFQSCTEMEYPPEIGAVTVGQQSFYRMFFNCTKLKEIEFNVSELATQTLQQSLYRCTSLNKIKVHFTDWAPSGVTRPTYNWVTQVASSGTFECPQALATTHGTSYIPNNWTVTKF